MSTRLLLAKAAGPLGKISSYSNPCLNRNYAASSHLCSSVLTSSLLFSSFLSFKYSLPYCLLLRPSFFFSPSFNFFVIYHLLLFFLFYLHFIHFAFFALSFALSFHFFNVLFSSLLLISGFYYLILSFLCLLFIVISLVSLFHFSLFYALSPLLIHSCIFYISIFFPFTQQWFSSLLLLFS